MRKLSRLESNREVRRVLTRNLVDMTWVQYSCAGYEIRLTGWLQKIDGTDFNGSQIESMIHDFQRHLNGYMIQGDLDNWNFTSDHISYLGDKVDSSKEQEEDFVDYVDKDYDYEAS
jgi:hypothetical protein